MKDGLTKSYKGLILFLKMRGHPAYIMYTLFLSQYFMNIQVVFNFKPSIVGRLSF